MDFFSLVTNILMSFASVLASTTVAYSMSCYSNVRCPQPIQQLAEFLLLEQTVTVHGMLMCNNLVSVFPVPKCVQQHTEILGSFRNTQLATELGQLTISRICWVLTRFDQLYQHLFSQEIRRKCRFGKNGPESQPIFFHLTTRSNLGDALYTPAPS